MCREVVYLCYHPYLVKTQSSHLSQNNVLYLHVSVGCHVTICCARKAMVQYVLIVLHEIT